MLNLEELEKMLNEALAKETTESWNNWHESHILSGLTEYVGDSVIDSFPVETGISNFTPRNKNIYAAYGSDNISAGENNYIQAA